MFRFFFGVEATSGCSSFCALVNFASRCVFYGHVCVLLKRVC